MKNIKTLLIVMFLSLFLSSCLGTQNEDINKAKEELLWENNSNISLVNDDFEETSFSGSFLDNKEKYEAAENTEVIKEKYSVEYLTDARFISLDSLEWKDLLSLKVEFTWKTLVDNVDKIIVNYSNSESEFPDDRYTLQTFNPGDSNFKYRAFDDFKTLDYWVNKYLIEAYVWKEVSKLEVILNVFKNEEDYIVKSESEWDSTISSIEKLSIDYLPESSEYWNPKEIGNGIYTYSDIKWLEIKNIWNIWLELDSDSVTNFLIENNTGWFYWNTLRPILWDNWVSFYVIRLDWENYLYEKHYYLENWIYWVVSLEKWTWVDYKNLNDKNNELGEKNDNFTITNITDKLFITILNN